MKFVLEDNDQTEIECVEGSNFNPGDIITVRNSIGFEFKAVIKSFESNFNKTTGQDDVTMYLSALDLGVFEKSDSSKIKISFDDMNADKYHIFKSH